jgi:hypothetical protein
LTRPWREPPPQSGPAPHDPAPVAPAPRPRPASGARKAAATERPLIGQSLRALQGKVVAIAAELRQDADRPRAAVIDKIVQQLRGTVFRIAVFGQVKAGKSSLVNALIGQPGLVPVNVNPWTSAVTRLHFGQPGGPEHGMTFRFFDAAEWRDLVDSGGPLCRLIQRLEPRLEREELAQAGAEMWARAEQRLGRQFHHLLGSAHNYAAVSGSVLSRYICCGEELDERRPEDGRYADITKSADLYFPAPPFALPTELIDTPGINDPLLIRDQITSRHLADADIHIVVLNAEQALCAIDLSLLRQLHGVHKDRIVVFVNRIDALNDAGTDCARVLASVRQHLDEEFPGSTIPIIAGSAWWGERAADLGPAALDRVPTQSLLAYAEARGVLRSRQRRRWHGAEPTLRAAMWRCSGMPDLADALAQLLQRRIGAPALEQAVAALRSTSFQVEKTALSELFSLRAIGQAAVGSAKANARQLERIQRDVGRLDALAQDLAAARTELDAEMALMIGVGLERLRIGLEGMVAAFADAEVAMLEAAGSGHKMPRRWRCNIGPLRQKLGAQFLEGYRSLAEELLATQEQIAAKVHRLFEKTAPDYDLAFDHEPPQPIDPSPSIAALGQLLAFDLGSPWQEWWRLWRTAESRTQRLRHLIRSEFERVIEDLMRAAKATLSQHIARCSDRFRAEISDTMAVMRTRQKQLAAIYEDLLKERRERSSKDLMDRHGVRLKACRARMAKLADQRRRLDAVLAALEPAEPAP